MGATHSVSGCDVEDVESAIESGDCTLVKDPEKGWACMSGDTGTFKATPTENSTGGFERTVTIVKELAVGDTIEGLDAQASSPLSAPSRRSGLLAMAFSTATTPRTTSCSTPPPATSRSTARSATAPSRTGTM